MAKPTAPYIGKAGKVDLDGDVFGEPFHMALVHEAVRAELNAKRRGTASTRTRGEVAMTGAKAFRQKGTGRARAGALSTPQRTGGGVAFGPKPRGFAVKVNRKARRRAMRAALTAQAERGTLAVIDAGAFDAPKTSQAAEALAGFAEGRVLVVFAREGEEAAVKSFRNLSAAEVLPADAVGVADVIRAPRLVVSEAALEKLTAVARAPERAKQEASA
ncbi:MAG: large subunit ribosomal protein [Thermoleophilaceae bacterium]|jgi:large subunit ribosomal protein L4|nr:large subunit ribosomal protein [Thermoleophilaceae bacterium]MEA2353865.1 large subunit ribosomal protein [Thermoleophilaceae bacterium]MEA2388784.1 large subunit ribosomal protein [Thermoleophilaceae bacterium]